MTCIPLVRLSFLPQPKTIWSNVISISLIGSVWKQKACRVWKDMRSRRCCVSVKWKSGKVDDGRRDKFLLWCLRDAHIPEMGGCQAVLPCRDQNLFKPGYTHWQQTTRLLASTHTYSSEHAHKHCAIYVCQVWQLLQRVLSCLFNIPVSWSPSLISCCVRACELTSCWITAFTYHTCQHGTQQPERTHFFTFYLPGLHIYCIHASA